MAMKFNFGKIKDIGKEVGKSLLGDSANVGLIAAGTIGSKKFLDFKQIFKNLPKNADGTEHWAIAHQGIIKFGAGLLTLGMFYKKMPPWLRMLMYGVMLEGGLTAARKYTTQKDGKSFFEQIGQGNQNLLPPITQQYQPSVAGDRRSEEANLFNENSASAVAGVSYQDEDDY